MLRRINASEIISSLKPEFAQFQKRVKYKPLYEAEMPDLSKYSQPVRARLSNELEQLSKRNLDELTGINFDDEIMSAKGAIESYAKQKNVTIDMARRINVVEGKTPELKDQVVVSVYNPKTKAHEFAFVPVMDNTQTVNTVKESTKVFTNTDGVQVIRPVKSEYEDNFIRNLYRNIEDAVKRSIQR